MKKHGTLVLCLLLLGLGPLSAGDPYYEISLGAGFSNYHLKDQLASPIIFRGTGISSELKAFRYGRVHNLFLEGSFSKTRLSSDAGNFKTENFRGSGRFGYEYSFGKEADSLGHFRFFTGCDLSSFYCKSDYYFYLQSFWAGAISSWYWRHSFDLNARAVIKISDKDKLMFRVILPVVSNISRPTFSSSGDYDYEANERVLKPFGSTVFISENFSVETSIAYYRQVSARMNMFCEYEFDFAEYDKPDNITMYMNNFRIGLSYNLKK